MLKFTFLITTYNKLFIGCFPHLTDVIIMISFSLCIMCLQNYKTMFLYFNPERSREHPLVRKLPL